MSYKASLYAHVHDSNHLIDGETVARTRKLCRLPLTSKVNGYHQRYVRRASSQIFAADTIRSTKSRLRPQSSPPLLLAPAKHALSRVGGPFLATARLPPAPHPTPCRINTVNLPPPVRLSRPSLTSLPALGQVRSLTRMPMLMSRCRGSGIAWLTSSPKGRKRLARRLSS